MELNFTVETKDVLLDMIKRHNKMYRMGTPEISDAEYDAEIELLKTLDPDNEWFKHTEPAFVPETRKRALPIPMKSLNKVKDISELKKWYMSLGLKGNAGVICMPKLDGLSLLYNELTGEAYSRGGIENEGQDCTSHYRASIQCYNPASSFNYTFGEFVINRSDWEQHFHGKRSKFTGDIFKSPRNTAAGLLNRDEPCDYLEHASFFRYGVDESSLHDYNNFHSLIETICNIYQQEHLYHFAFIDELNEELLMNLFKEWSKVYPIDGIVIYIDDLHLWEVIGRHQTSGNPLYAIAYKHPDFTESFETTVKGIVWKVSKSGALKPVVNIEMVDTGDCNMENPTGYNAGWINDHEIAKGAEILVTRSGGVIPKILSTLSPATQEEQEKLWDEMSECPHCGSSTMWNENHIELCCTNPSCPGVQLAKIIFFYLTCGAENMGEETLSKIFNAGFTSIPAILNVTFNDLIKIEGFGDSISNIILENNRKIMQGVDLATLMQASDCFKGIGKIKAQKILDEMDDEDLCSFCQGWYINHEPDVQSEDFKNCPITVQNLLLGYFPFMAFLEETKIPYKLSPKTAVLEGKCKGLSICVSGFRDSNLEEVITNEGGKIVSGVSKKTTHLVVKDKSANSSKMSKAKLLGIPILSIEEFYEILNN